MIKHELIIFMHKDLINLEDKHNPVHELGTSDAQAGFRKRRNGDQIVNIHWITEKAREFQENIYFCFIDCTKALTVWITTNCEKLLKRWEYQITLPAS